MSERAIILWFVAGFPIAVVDAWLSVQAMFGLIHPANGLGYLVAISSGIALTVFAVYVPIVRGSRPSIILVVVWLVALGIDILTSIIGAIWYGVLGKPLGSAVDFSAVYFEPANWLETLLFVGFVLALAFFCVKFGQALNALNEKYRARYDARAP
jgi:hypothetical protein